MSCFRVLLAIIFPPLAVIDKGCGSIVIVSFLTLFAWIPGIIGALVIVASSNSKTVVVYQRPGTPFVRSSAQAQTPASTYRPMSLDEILAAIRRPLEKFGDGILAVIQYIWRAIGG